MICGIGIDVVDVARIRRAEARWGERFLKRVFTGREISYCRTKKDPHPHLAARFAAKEAVIKAVAGLWEDPTAFDSKPLTAGGPVDDPAGDHQNEGTQRVSRQRGLQPRHLGFRDIEILNHPTGRPYISLGASFLKTPADLLIHLSMSHEEDVAVATVVLEKRSGQRL